MKEAEKLFDGMLKAAGLPRRGSYRPEEVCRILGISYRTFWRMTEAYEKDPESNEPLKPNALDSFRLRKQRRVRFDELVDYIRRNNIYEREHAYR